MLLMTMLHFPSATRYRIGFAQTSAIGFPIWVIETTRIGGLASAICVRKNKLNWMLDDIKCSFNVSLLNCVVAFDEHIPCLKKSQVSFSRFFGIKQRLSILLLFFYFAAFASSLCVFALNRLSSQQMPGFDVEVARDELRGKLVGQGIDD